jgi:hypothetical protein
MSKKERGSKFSIIKFLIGSITTLFIALKLLEVIDWSWVWVLAPLWISAVLTGLFFGLVILIAIVIAISKERL